MPKPFSKSTPNSRKVVRPLSSFNVKKNRSSKRLLDKDEEFFAKTKSLIELAKENGAPQQHTDIASGLEFQRILDSRKNLLAKLETGVEICGNWADENFCCTEEKRFVTKCPCCDAFFCETCIDQHLNSISENAYGQQTCEWNCNNVDFNNT